MEIDIKMDPRAQTMAQIVQSWIGWDRDEREREGLITDEDTSIMSLPVPMWPSHGQLKEWVKYLRTLKDTTEE